MDERPTVLIGASGIALEVIAAITSSRHPLPSAILDDDPSRMGEILNGVKVEGGIDSIERYPTAQLVICVGSGTSRRALAQRLTRCNVGPDRYRTIVHPRASVESDCVIGTGSIVLAGVVVTANVRIGAHVVAMPNVVATHDCVIDDFATVCAGVVLGGGVRIGEAAYLGMNASVRQNLSVGTEAVLGMGSVLLQTMPPDSTWVGVPARPLRKQSSYHVPHVEMPNMRPTE